MNRDWLKLAAALLLGVAIALPAGMWLAGGSERSAPATPPADTLGYRQPYSPKVLSDPHFLAEQRKGIEALEQSCRGTGQFCTEAAAGRRWLDEHAGN